MVYSNVTSNQISQDYTGYPPSITVTYPNASGITWQVGDAYDITWDCTGNTDSLCIELYKDNTAHMEIAICSSSDSAFHWMVPPGIPEGSDYRIKITLLVNPSIEDFSDNYFTILSGTLVELVTSGITQTALLPIPFP